MVTAFIKEIRIGDIIAIYAALVSTYVALKPKMDRRPSLTVMRPSTVRPGSILVTIKNPDDHPIIIFGQQISSRRSFSIDDLLKATPCGDPHNGIGGDYAGRLLSGDLSLFVPANGEQSLFIGPIYEKTDAIFSLRWERPSWNLKSARLLLQKFVNPLRLRVTADLERKTCDGCVDL